MTAEDHAKRIVGMLGKYRFRLDNEKLLQEQVCAVFLDQNIPAKREHRLSSTDIVDFMCGSVAVECKIKGQRRAIYRQCQRYCEHDSVDALVLVTNAAMGMPPDIAGVPVYVVSLGKGWM